MSSPPSSSQQQQQQQSSGWLKLKSLRRASDIIPPPSIASIIRGFTIGSTPDVDEQHTPLDEHLDSLTAKLSCNSALSSNDGGGLDTSGSLPAPCTNSLNTSAAMSPNQATTAADTGSRSSSGINSGDSDTDEQEHMYSANQSEVIDDVSGVAGDPVSRSSSSDEEDVVSLDKNNGSSNNNNSHNKSSSGDNDSQQQQQNNNNNNNSNSVNVISTTTSVGAPGSSTDAIGVNISPGSSNSPSSMDRSLFSSAENLAMGSSSRAVSGNPRSPLSPSPEPTSAKSVHSLDNSNSSGQATAESSAPSASASSSQAANNSGRKKKDDENPFSIRLTPFVDHSSVMPAQYISVVERKSKDGGVIRIGRYSDRREADERANSENQPIVFKSKVVSRSHAEIFVQDGKWYIKDVKSSSGTFLNHVRLSPACQTSTPHLLSDGDMLQLGMDFRGGSEELYKCIRVRVELNRSWHKRANEFNKQALTMLRSAYNQSSDTNLQECAICLLPVSPCQALFVAPCSHGWHYKCIRPLVVKTYPHFLCPNCRSLCDLEADIEAESEEEEDGIEDGKGGDKTCANIIENSQIRAVEAEALQS